MRRLLLAGLLAGIVDLGPAQQPAEKPPLGETLKAAVGSEREGARARAVLVNEASARVNELIAALKHEDDDVRVSAAWALRYCASKQAVGPLAAALRDENFSVARAAAVSLNQFKAAERPLRELMGDKDPAMRWRGMINVDYVVGQLPAGSRKRLLDDVAGLAMNDPVDFVRADSAWTLRHAGGPKVAEALMKCLADPDPRTRYQAGIGLRGAVATELMRKGSPTRKQAVATLLWILENRRDRPQATAAAVDRLTALVIEPLGTHPGRWRDFLKKVEGEK